MKCPKCGKEVNGKFCSECGTPVEQEIPVAEPVSPPEKPVDIPSVEQSKPAKKKISKVEITLLIVITSVILCGIIFFTINTIRTNNIERELEEKANSISNVFNDIEPTTEAERDAGNLKFDKTIKVRDLYFAVPKEWQYTDVSVDGHHGIYHIDSDAFVTFKTEKADYDYYKNGILGSVKSIKNEYNRYIETEAYGKPSVQYLWLYEKNSYVATVIFWYKGYSYEISAYADDGDFADDVALSLFCTNSKE